MKEAWQRERKRWRLLLESVPPGAMLAFVLSVVAMNLLANKSIALPVDWLALDCGIIVSWLAFLVMDILTRHFGPAAASRLSALAILCNLFFCLLLYVGSAVPGVWGESFVPGGETLINTALDRTFGGTWYVLLGSTAAFLASAVINNYVNYAVGLALGNRDGFGTYAARTYLSTAVGQFADNLIFALLVSHVFFGWTLLQCVTCALTGMAVELLCEAAFSPLGFRVDRRWKREGVGRAYLEWERGEEKA